MSSWILRDVTGVHRVVQIVLSGVKFKQGFDRQPLSAHARILQRSHPGIVGRVDVSALGDQELDHLQMAVERCIMKWRFAVSRRLRVHARAPRQEQLRDIDLSRRSCEIERRVAVRRVPCERVGAAREQQQRDRNAVEGGCDHQRRSPLAIAGVDWRAAIDEQPGDAGLIGDRRPMERVDGGRLAPGRGVRPRRLQIAQSRVEEIGQERIQLARAKRHRRCQLNRRSSGAIGRERRRSAHQ